MYRKLILSMGVSALTLGGVTAQAETSKVYFGGNIAALKYTESRIDDDATLRSLYGRLGIKINDNFSGELRAGMGLRDETLNRSGSDVSIELDHMYGAYIRGGFQANDEISPYVILGYTGGELISSEPGSPTVTTSTSDISMGFGLDFLVDNLTVNIEYMRYLNKDGVKVSGPAFGISSSF